MNNRTEATIQHTTGLLQRTFPQYRINGELGGDRIGEYEAYALRGSSRYHFITRYTAENGVYRLSSFENTLPGDQRYRTDDCHCLEELFEQIRHNNEIFDHLLLTGNLVRTGL